MSSIWDIQQMSNWSDKRISAIIRHIHHHVPKVRISGPHPQSVERMIRSKSSSAHNRLWWCGDKLTHGGIVRRRRIETKDAGTGDRMWLDVDIPCCRTENLLQVYLFYVNLNRPKRNKLYKTGRTNLCHPHNEHHSFKNIYLSQQPTAAAKIRPSLKTPKHNRHASQKRRQPRNTFAW